MLESPDRCQVGNANRGALLESERWKQQTYMRLVHCDLLCKRRGSELPEKHAVANL